MLECVLEYVGVCASVRACVSVCVCVSWPTNMLVYFLRREIQYNSIDLITEMRRPARRSANTYIARKLSI